MRMNMLGKGLGASLVVGMEYVNHTFSPLFWVLLVLAGIDVVLNVSAEAKQFEKLGSAFAAVGGVSLLEGHLTDPAILKVAVGVLVLAYLQVVVPQLIALIRRLKFTPNQKINQVEQHLLIARLQSENANLKAQAEAQVQTAAPPAAQPPAAAVSKGFHV